MNTRLVLQAQRRDKDAFVTLIGLYRESMYQIAYAILKNNEDAADAMQDTILICWEKIDTLRHARYFKTWMTRILINRCNRLYSQRNRTTDLNEGTFSSISPDPAARMEWQEMMQQLTDNQRIVVELYYAQQFKIHEIAEILDITPSAVKNRLHTARKVLKQYISSNS